MSRFDSKAAVIIGAAQGIGRAVAEAFAAEGAGVVLFDLNADALDEARAAIEGSGGRCRTTVGDAANRADIARAVAECASGFGRIDYLVANAAVDSKSPFLETTDLEWDRHLSVNLRGTWYAVQEAVRQMMREAHGGAIVVVTSTNAFQPERHQSAYNASKAAQVSLAKTAAMEFGSYGIRVNALAPGIIDTPRTAYITSAPERLDRFLAQIPLGRLGRPRDIANAVLFLCSDEAAYISGSTVVVDGAYSTGLPAPTR